MKFDIVGIALRPIKHTDRVMEVGSAIELKIAQTTGRVPHVAYVFLAGL